MIGIQLGETSLQTPPTNLDHNARWTSAEKLLLAVLGGVVFLDTLDLSLVQVALPAIGSALSLPKANCSGSSLRSSLATGGSSSSEAGAPTCSAASACSCGAWSRSS